MQKEKTLYITNRQKWRDWLQKNHDKKKEIWLIYYKKHTNTPTIPYNDAVEEAISFGWIDGKVRRIDDARYMQRYTPRNPKSLWSELNIKRANKMIRENKMTKKGLKIFKDAMKNKQLATPIKEKPDMPPKLKKALKKNKKAWENFQNLAPSYKTLYIYWILDAKREETRERRIKQAVKAATENKKLPTT